VGDLKRQRIETENALRLLTGMAVTLPADGRSQPAFDG
jgi:hypothetical protein